MTLADQLSALAANIGGVVKALTSRVTTLEGRTQVVTLTQAAYDALATKDPAVVYVITP